MFYYPWILLGGSLVGLVASIWQAAERVQMLAHPSKVLACDLNPVIDCGSVLGNRWSALFGFPNAFLGIAMFAILLMAGIALVTRTKLSRGFLYAITAVSIVLILFSLWFFSMSLYVIGNVCIFCIFIWAVSVPIFWYGLLNHWRERPPRRARVQRLEAFARRHHAEVVVLVYIALAALYFLRFRAYYFG